MRTRSSADEDLARQLLVHESAGLPDGSPGRASAAAVHARLFARLEPLIGTAGTMAVLVRSAKLIEGEYPCFAAALDRDAPDVSTSAKLAACWNELAPDDVNAASSALFGTMLALLTTLIGPVLIRQIVRTAFPRLPQ